MNSGPCGAHRVIELALSLSGIWVVDFDDLGPEELAKYRLPQITLICLEYDLTRVWLYPYLTEILKDLKNS